MPRLEKNLIIKRCPHCNVDNPNLTQVTRFTTVNYNNRNSRIWIVYSCQRCGGATTAWAQNEQNLDIQQMFPSPIILDSSIPIKAKAYLEQAIESLHAPSGAIMLAASSIDSMLKDKSYKEGSLYARINTASTDHLITKEMASWAHQVRLGANDERHADDEAPLPTDKDAQRTVDFALALAEFLFVMPSRVERGIAEAKTP